MRVVVRRSIAVCVLAAALLHQSLAFQVMHQSTARMSQHCQVRTSRARLHAYQPPRRSDIRHSFGTMPYTNARYLAWYWHANEASNPSIFPPYKPWWLSYTAEQVDALPEATVRGKARQLGWDDGAPVSELKARIQVLLKRSRLTDDNFASATVSWEAPAPQPCYPEVYDPQMAGKPLHPVYHGAAPPDTHRAGEIVHADNVNRSRERIVSKSQGPTPLAHPPSKQPSQRNAARKRNSSSPVAKQNDRRNQKPL